MASDLNPSLSIAWLCLIAAPPVAAGTFFAIRRYLPDLLTTLSIACASLVLAVVGARLLDISFTSASTNTLCLSAAYFSYCFLATSTWRLRRLTLRIPALVVAALPVAMGYMLGTVGTLALMFMIGDYTRPPLQTTEMAPHLECRVTDWGMAASDTGYTVHLYKRWPAAPFLEREIAYIVVNETHPRPGLASASCDDALKEVH